MVLFIMLYKVVVPFESVDEIVKCEHSNIKLFSSSFLCVVDTLFQDKF